MSGKDTKSPTQRLGRLDSPTKTSGVRLGRHVRVWYDDVHPSLCKYFSPSAGSLRGETAGAGSSGPPSGIGNKFRPRNFLKPEPTSADQGEITAADASLSPAPTAAVTHGANLRRGRHHEGRHRMGPEPLLQQVIFGGVIGAGATHKTDGEALKPAQVSKDSIPKSEPISPRAGPSARATPADKRPDILAVDTSSSSSSDTDSNNDRNGVPQPPRGKYAYMELSQVENSVPTELSTRGPDDTAALTRELSALISDNGLLGEEDGGPELMLFQLPSVLPVPVPSMGQTGEANTSAGRPASLAELPPTKLGKLLVMRSGAVKMQIGEVLFDVTPGIPCRSRQEVAVVDVASKECTMVGHVAQRVVVTPDVDVLLSNEPLPQWKRATSLRRQRRALVGDSSDEESD